MSAILEGWADASGLPGPDAGGPKRSPASCTRSFKAVSRYSGSTAGRQAAMKRSVALKKRAPFR